MCRHQEINKIKQTEARRRRIHDSFLVPQGFPTFRGFRHIFQNTRNQKNMGRDQIITEPGYQRQKRDAGIQRQPQQVEFKIQ